MGLPARVHRACVAVPLCVLVDSVSALWLRAVPLWAWVLLAALVCIGVQQWRVSHYKAQVASITANHAVEAQRVAELATKASEAARAAEHTQAAAFDAIAQQYEQDKTDAQAKADRTIAELRTGNLRLRDMWATQARASEVAASAGQPDAAADGCSGVAIDLFRAIDPIVQQQDAQIRGLQAVLRAERSEQAH